MRQTEHYGLNQWELTDRILMADFNADNAKIAAALARLQENVVNLAYYVGQIGVLHSLNNVFYTSQAPIFSDAFQKPHYFTAAGDAFLEKGRAAMNGKGAVGSVTTRRSFMLFDCRTTMAYAWIHRNGGKVIPRINGTPMREGRVIYDNNRTGSAGHCYEFILETPFIRELELTLDMECGTSSSMEIIDVSLAWV